MGVHENEGRGWGEKGGGGTYTNTVILKKKKKKKTFWTQEDEQEDAAVRINTRVIHTPIHRSILHSLGISTYYKILIP